MTTTPGADDDGMNDLVKIVKREPPDDDSSYCIMPLESLQTSPWPQKKSE